MPASAEAPDHRKLLAEAASQLSDYSISFLKIRDEKPVDAELAGSGTLIVVGSRYAVLTACHVLEHLPNSGPVGLVLSTRLGARLHRATLDMTYATKMRVGRGAIESEGPDIGVLLLPTPIVGAIKAVKSFYNLVQHQHQVHGNDGDGIVWMLCGMAHEWTRDGTPERGYERVKVFRGCCGAGIVENARVVGEFDYVDFKAKYDDAYEGPHCYGGFSGGGLWQLVVAETPGGELAVKKKVLSGVIFYQSKLEDHTRTIVCHGSQSVYRVVLNAIESS